MIERLLFSLPRAMRSSPPEQRLLALVRDGAELLRRSTTTELQATAGRLRQSRREPNAQARDLLAAAFAAVLEAVRRAHGLELYDVQLRAALAIARGDIAEMQTGEGKTLAAALPAFWHSIDGGGVHVVTPNSYLAARDFELLAPVYRALGATVALLPENAPFPQKRAAYECDITYGTGYEFGFDYLREQLGVLKRRRAPLGERYRGLLRGDEEPPLLGARRGFAIVDEIDSVLIDEACTPLILSDAMADPAVAPATYEQALAVAANMVAGRDFLVDADRLRSVSLTEAGRRNCYQAITSDREMRGAGPWSDSVQQALQATHVLARDVDYVVRDGKVVFVDAATGRLCPDRSWRNGLQQLLETKEGVPLTPARPTAARITRQRYSRLYDRLAGMTGTAAQSALEFRTAYGLRVATIPPRLPSRRNLLPDRMFIDDRSRLRAVEAEIANIHATGRPLLVGCRTIEQSERLSLLLDRMGFEHQLLNGKQSAAEAEVIARAGRRGAVTIATNMAGRGTDIKLEPGVDELGGMHLIAVEYNDSERVDRQLIGRVARQGDPGSCQFFVSADDPLFESFGAALRRQVMALPHTAGEIQADLSRQSRAVQRRVEAAGFRMRKELAAADNWLREDLGDLLL